MHQALAGGPVLLRHPLVTLPIATPIYTGRSLHGQRRDGPNLGAVVRPAMILAPSALLGIPDEVLTGDVVMVANFSPAHPGEELIGAVRADAVLVSIQAAMIDPAHIKLGVQIVP